jgi:hypothetical protein
VLINMVLLLLLLQYMQMKGRLAIIANLQHTLAGACQALQNNATAVQVGRRRCSSSSNRQHA